MFGQKTIILIHPPVSVVSEPPAGMARLAGFLKAAGADCRVVDLNIEGLTWLAADAPGANDTWTRRAKAAIVKNMAALRSPDLYESPARYKRAVMDVNRVLHMAGREKGVRLSLSNYTEAARTPVRSRDLLDAALAFEKNPFYTFFRRRLDDAFADHTPDIAGFSVNFMGQALCASAIAGFIKAHFPATRIVFGGGLITSWSKLSGFSNPLPGIADDMVDGPGETVTGAMCGLDETTLSVVPGYPYDYSGFDPDRYLSPGRILPVSASDGCYWRKCAFCPEKAEKKTYRSYPPEVIACSTYPGCRGESEGPALIHFLDNALSPRFMKYLVENPPGSPWYGFARITPHLADPDFVEGLAASGCVMLQTGIESGDQRVLDAAGKGVRVETIAKALKTLQASPIAVYGYLLFGTPGENEASAVKTRDFILAYADCIDFLNLAIFNLPAYCREVDDLETRPFYPGDLSLYRDFIHPQGWHRDRVRRFLARDFKREGPIRKILNNDPPFFTSNHAPFFRRVLKKGAADG